MSVTNTDRAPMVEEKRRPALFHRIQTRLIVTFSLLFVAVLTTVELTSIWGVPFTGYKGRKGQEEARTFRQLGLIADLKKSHLQNTMAELARDIRMFVDNDIVRINVARLRAATREATNAGLTATNLRTALRREESYHVVADYLNSLSTMYDTFGEVHIVDGKTGTILVSVDKEDEGRSVAREAFFAGALQFGGAYFGDIKRCPLTGQPTLCLSRAIADIDAETFERKANAISAVLALNVNVEKIITLMLNIGEGLGETGEVLLVNHKRRIITSLKHPLADGTRARPLEHEILAQPAVLAAQGAEGIIEAEDYRGNSVLAAYRHIRVTPEWGWGLVVKRDTAELFAPLRQDISYSVAIGLAGILAVVGLTVFLAKSLTRPILALSLTAEQVSEGDRAAYAPVIGSDEVARLATTFNTMLHRIHNWHTELEGQVELRTAELDRANDKLRAGITERKQAETTLRRSNERLAATAGELKSLMKTVTEDKMPSVRFSNPSVVRCWEVKNCEREACPAYGHQGGPRCWEVAGTLCGGVVQGTFAQKLGDCRECEVYQHARKDSIGELGETFNEMIAVLEERQRALREAAKVAEVATVAKSEFLANMSHEIRTPMTAILGFAENLLDSDQSESQKLDAIHTIRRNGENLLSIINDILDLSKIEAGRMAVEYITCEPYRIIAEVASLMRGRADERNLPISVEYVGVIPETIRSDPVRLRQILINLIANAIKFTEVGGVRLLTRLVNDNDEPRLQFDVIDTGRGMTEEQVSKLFQPFVQADTSTTREFGGTGLGLTISKRFARLLGGDIAVVETEVGGGTTVRAAVATGPLDGVKMLENPMSPTVAADAAHTGAHIERSDLEGCRILLAEDGLDNQRLIEHVLKKAGAEVTIVENGKLAVDAALAALNRRREGDPQRPFDVILMDMQMPIMDGYEATGLLRQKGYSGTIIALTAHAMASDRQKCIDAGCDDYATKPIDRQKLIETIQAHLQSIVELPAR